MIHRIYAIALNTFREAMRDRVLIGVLGFATAVLMFTLVLAELSLDQQLRVVTDIGLASISLFAVVVAIFLGSSLLYKEIERKTLYVILPKPIQRFEFLLGKYAGIVVTGIVFICTMGAIQMLVTSVQGGAPLVRVVSVAAALLGLLVAGLLVARDRTPVVAFWSFVAVAAAGLLLHRVEGVEHARIYASLVLACGEVMVLAAVALLFSSFSTPFLTGAFTFGVWVLGRSADDMATMKSKLLSEFVRNLLHGFAEVVPNFVLFVPGRRTLLEANEVYGGPVQYVLSTMAYAGLYSAILLIIAVVIFRRRDLI